LSVSWQRDQTVKLFGTPGKVTGHRIKKGDVVIMESAGGGGYGDPLNRDPEDVRSDLLSGYITRHRAEAGYGVLFTGEWEVDVDRTSALRLDMRGQRLRLTVKADETDPYIGNRGKRRVVRLSEETIIGLGVRVGDLVELLGNHPAPLRCWIESGEKIEQDICPMDEFGRRVLGVEQAESVWVRPLPGPSAAGGMAV